MERVRAEELLPGFGKAAATGGARRRARDGNASLAIAGDDTTEGHTRASMRRGKESDTVRRREGLRTMVHARLRVSMIYLVFASLLMEAGNENCRSRNNIENGYEHSSIKYIIRPLTLH